MSHNRQKKCLLIIMSSSVFVWLKSSHEIFAYLRASMRRKPKTLHRLQICDKAAHIHHVAISRDALQVPGAPFTYQFDQLMTKPTKKHVRLEKTLTDLRTCVGLSEAILFYILVSRHPKKAYLNKGISDDMRASIALSLSSPDVYAIPLFLSTPRHLYGICSAKPIKKGVKYMISMRRWMDHSVCDFYFNQRNNINLRRSLTHQ